MGKDRINRLLFVTMLVASHVASCSSPVDQPKASDDRNDPNYTRDPKTLAIKTPHLYSPYSHRSDNSSRPNYPLNGAVVTPREKPAVIDSDVDNEPTGRVDVYVAPVSTDEQSNAEPKIEIIIPEIFNAAEPIKEKVEKWFIETNLDAKYHTLLMAQMMQESRFNLHEGGGGILQINISNRIRWCEENPTKCQEFTNGQGEADPDHPDLMAISGIEYMVGILEANSNLGVDEQKIAALAAFNGGPAAGSMALEVVELHSSGATQDQIANAKAPYIEHLVNLGWSKHDVYDENGELVRFGASTKANIVIGYVTEVLKFEALAQEQIDQIKENNNEDKWPVLLE